MTDVTGWGILLLGLLGLPILSAAAGLYRVARRLQAAATDQDQRLEAWMRRPPSTAP